jgi:homoserine dehydrogenase
MHMIELPVILFGLGGVGRSLVRQILDNRAFHAETYGLRIRFVALCDSRSAIIEPTDGLFDADIEAALALKKEGKSLTAHELGGSQDDLPAIVDIAGIPGTVVVDCSATDQTTPALLFALSRGYKVVLANKKPLTIQQEVYDRLTRAGDTGHAPRDLARLRWETTVGAGLPVIATLTRLVASGDVIQRVAGTFSGTLGFLMTGLESGRLFSEVVREAHQLGYTEPDPRDDLGGVDVARKALILARGMGHRLEMKDVEVKGLYPPLMESLSVAEFMDALPQLDEHYQDEVARAAAEGKVLRYAATIQVTEGRVQCSVGPTAVEKDTPLGRLSGTDNLIALYSRWYSPNPLVIQGRGAGVDVTAAGVLSDVVEMAYTV